MLAALMAQPVAAAPPKDHKFGAGIMVGTLNSINGKYWLSDRGALDFGFGITFDPWTVLYADYLWHFPGLFGTGSEFGRQTSGYLGGGAGVGFWGRSGDCGRWHCNSTSGGATLFVRGLFGAEWTPDNPTLGVFAELGPGLGLVPGVGGFIDVGVGIRYYF
jgi:hypothetical protein